MPIIDSYFLLDAIARTFDISLPDKIEKAAKKSYEAVLGIVQLVSKVFFTALASLKAGALALLCITDSPFYYLAPKRYSYLLKSTKEAFRNIASSTPSNRDSQAIETTKSQLEFSASQKTFEEINACYSIFKGVLASLQQIPEFTSTITKIRQLLIFTDLLSTRMTYYYQHKNLRKSHPISFGLYAAQILAIVGVSFYFHSSPLPTSLSNDRIKWVIPDSEKIHRIVRAAQLVASFGLAYFSKVPKTVTGASLIAQITSFAGSLSFSWLEVKQRALPIQIRRYLDPLSHLGTCYGDIKTLLQVPSKVNKDINYLQKIINQIEKWQKTTLWKGTYITNVYINHHFKYGKLNFSSKIPNIKGATHWLSSGVGCMLFNRNLLISFD